ncbi:MAG: diguanylate cyclase, partial [Rhodospirillales bacterium]
MARKKDKKFPALNTQEAEEIVRELGRALDVHREWTIKFRTMLVCRTKPKAADLNAGSHRKTVFGKWYFGGVNPNLRDHPNFKVVGKNSRLMHDAARRLARLVLDDADIKPAQYQTFIKSNDRFQRSVRKLLSEAWDFLRFTDPLTGVMTRATMKPRLEAEQERSRRTGQPCAVAMMDLDRFKKVNDTHGHRAGDRVLKAIAGYAHDNLRRYDQVFRYGGEEFVLLLPNTTIINAKRVLDR